MTKSLSSCKPFDSWVRPLDPLDPAPAWLSVPTVSQHHFTSSKPRLPAGVPTEWRSIRVATEVQLFTFSLAVVRDRELQEKSLLEVFGDMKWSALSLFGLSLYVKWNYLSKGLDGAWLSTSIRPHCELWGNLDYIDICAVAERKTC